MDAGGVQLVDGRRPEGVGVIGEQQRPFGGQIADAQARRQGIVAVVGGDGAAGGVTVVAQPGQDAQLAGQDAEGLQQADLSLPVEAGEFGLGVGHAAALSPAGAAVLLVAVALGAIGEGDEGVVGERKARPVVQAEPQGVDVALQDLADRAAAGGVQAQLVGGEGGVVDAGVDVEQRVVRIVIAIGQTPGVGGDLLLPLVAAGALAVVGLLGGVGEALERRLDGLVRGQLDAQLGEAGDDVVVRLVELRSVAQVDRPRLAQGEAGQDVDLLRRPGEGGDGAQALVVGGLETAADAQAGGLAGGQQVLGPLGAELDHAAGAAAAVERRGRAAQDLHLAEQAGIDEEAAVVAGLEVLPRPVDEDHHVGAGEAANAGGLAGAPGTAGEFHAGHPTQDVVGRGRRQAVDLLRPHDRHHSGIGKGFHRAARRGHRYRSQADRRGPLGRAVLRPGGLRRRAGGDGSGGERRRCEKAGRPRAAEDPGVHANPSACLHGSDSWLAA